MGRSWAWESRDRRTAAGCPSKPVQFRPWLASIESWIFVSFFHQFSGRACSAIDDLDNTFLLILRDIL